MENILLSKIDRYCTTSLLLICFKLTWGIEHIFPYQRNARASRGKSASCALLSRSHMGYKPLISDALLLTFATMRHYQKGLDFPGLTFRPWVRYINITQSKQGPIPLLVAFREMLKKQCKVSRWERRNTLMISILYISFRINWPEHVQ